MGRMITISYWPCKGYNKKCTVMLNDGNAKAGRLPELCPDCKREKEKDSLKLRQRMFTLRQKTMNELV